MLGRLNILIRYKMVRYKCNLILIKYSFYCHLIHLMNCNRRCNIISKYKV